MEYYYFSITIFFSVILLASAQIRSDRVFADKPWVLAVLIIVLVLIVAILSALTTLSCIYFIKHKCNGQQDVSNDHSNLSVSDSQHNQDRHVSGFPSPPPPYPIFNGSGNVFTASSPTPPYSSLPVQNAPATTTRATGAVDSSSPLISSSIQTFQA